MSFAARWQKSKVEMSKLIDKMDNIHPQNISVNSVNENPESKKQFPCDSVNIVNVNCQMKKLLDQVGAHIRLEHDGKVLAFTPPLPGPLHDQIRWKLAEELEDIFLTQEVN